MLHEIEEADLRDRIEQVVEEYPRYGYRRVTHHLRREGFKVNHKRVDLMLNGMNGFEAISLIRQVPKTRSIPIIAITAGLSNTVEEECARIGCNDFLFKPFTASQLSSIITKLLSQNGS